MEAVIRELDVGAQWIVVLDVEGEALEFEGVRGGARGAF